MTGIRQAQPSDAQSCAELCKQALDELEGRRGGALFTRREAGLVAKALLRPGGLPRLLDDPRRRVFVGTDSGSDLVVGLAVGRVEEVGEASLGVLDGLYVSAEMRRAGIGRGLVESLLAWFRSSGCRGIDATALPGDRDTKNFFESAGFKARLLTMYRSLT